MQLNKCACYPSPIRTRVLWTIQPLCVATSGDLHLRVPQSIVVVAPHVEAHLRRLQRRMLCIVCRLVGNGGAIPAEACSKPWIPAVPIDTSPSDCALTHLYLTCCKPCNFRVVSRCRALLQHRGWHLHAPRSLQKLAVPLSKHCLPASWVW